MESKVLDIKVISSNFFRYPGSIIKIIHWEDIAFILVLCVLVFSRFYPVRLLDYPMWGDSYQHTVITQLMLDNGGLFSSWQPYADMTSLTYHFGFHSLSAVFAWVTGVTATQAVLIMGQLLNILAVLGVYLLVVRFSGNRWAGIIALIIAGLASPMPMFYVNWGRYTQLTGQAILPIAILITLDIFHRKKLVWKVSILGWIVISGLALTHYVILIFYIIFVIVYFSISLKGIGIKILSTRLAILAGGAIILFLPWFIHVFDGKILSITASHLTPVASINAILPKFIPGQQELVPYLPMWLWVLFALCILWGLWSRRKEILGVILWFFCLWFVSHLDTFGLPGSGIITSFAVLIFAYLPVSIIVVVAFTAVIQKMKVRDPLRTISLFVICLVGLIIWLKATVNTVQANIFALVTKPDIRAAEWIRANTDSSDSVIVGTDAGWWLPLSAGRMNSTPPLNYSSESEADPSYRVWVSNLARFSIKIGLTDPDIFPILKEYGITHIYIGQLQGQVNPSSYNLTIDPEVLLGDKHYLPIYHQDRVWIFEIID
jgi:hypothetical protein